MFRLGVIHVDMATGFHHILEVALLVFPTCILQDASETMTASVALVSPDASDDDAADALLQLFSNGSGAVEVSRNFKSRVETQARRQRFINETGYVPSPDLLSLPYVFNRKPHRKSGRKGKFHFMGDVYFVVTTVAVEAGFDGPIPFVNTKGFSLKKLEGGQYYLAFRRLEDTLKKAKHDNGHNVFAMLQQMYKLLHREHLINPYEGVGRHRFIKFDQFIDNLNHYTPMFLNALRITETFFLPHVKEKADDTMFWWKEICYSLDTHKKAQLFFNNMFSLFHADHPGNGVLIRKMLTHHLKSLDSYVATLCIGKNHDDNYRLHLEQALADSFPKSRKWVGHNSRFPHLLLLRCRARDDTKEFLRKEDQLNFQSCTKKVTANKNKRRNTGELRTTLCVI